MGITEPYKQFHWPKQESEAFRKVINAASYFKKVVLVLEKKSWRPAAAETSWPRETLTLGFLPPFAYADIHFRF